MTLTVKLDDELNRAVRQYALARGETTSQVVREALAEYLVKRAAPKPSAYELGKDLFGAVGPEGGGPSDLASRRKEIYLEVLEQRDAERRARAEAKLRKLR